MAPHRIPTTHVGSLPRSEEVAELLFAKERGEPVDRARWDEVMARAVESVVARQRACGIDLPSDGETSKISYATYVKDRLTGFDGDSPRTPPADLERYPSFMRRLAEGGGTPTYRRPRCVGPVAVKDLSGLDADLARFKAALDRTGYATGFVNAASPGVIALFQPSDHHPTREAYLADLASAMPPSTSGSWPPASSSRSTPPTSGSAGT
jgi:5-methyltetrahydropteroyltriglutamate--homocysteine methyltransferase